MKKLTESLDHLDMENEVYPILSIDKYQAQIGRNDQMITLTFTVKQREVGEDLVDWLERGYDWIIDAETSPGEVAKSKYLVFAEMNRRTTAPEKIIELLGDLKTLTNLDITDWKLDIDGKQSAATVDFITNNITLSPQDYREQHETELNEWREIAGLSTTAMYDTDDQDIKNIQRQAGII